MNKVFVFIALCLLTLTAKAQGLDTVRKKSRQDSLNRVRDSVTSKPVLPKILAKKNKKKYNPDSTHSPGLAFRRSGFVPGWGQLYNHRWWKVPLIYAGLGSLGLAVEFNHRNYKQFLKVYQMRRGGERPAEDATDDVSVLFRQTQNVPITSLENAVSGYQRNFQLSILGILGGWGIQMIDAYIDAKFIHSYTMDRDLSFKISPGIAPVGTTYAYNSMPSVMPVLKLTFTLK